MQVKIAEVHELIGALKSQYMYQSSNYNKAKKEGKIYSPDYKQTGDLLFLLVDELEKATSKVENLKMVTTISLSITIEDANISMSKNGSLNNTESALIDLPDVEMPPI